MRRPFGTNRRATFHLIKLELDPLIGFEKPFALSLRVRVLTEYDSTRSFGRSNTYVSIDS